MNETIDLAALTAANVTDGDSLLGMHGNSLKKVKVGNENGNILLLTKFPNRQALADNGYLQGEAATSTTLPPYIEAVFKYLAATYPKGGVFIGQGSPSSQGIMIVHTYGGMSPNGSGLPPYGSCLFLSISEYYTAYVSNGVFHAGRIIPTPVSL